MPLIFAVDLVGVGKAAVTGTNVGVGAGAELAAALELATLDVAALAALLEATLLEAVVLAAALLGAALLAADEAALVVAAAAELLGAALLAAGALLAALCEAEVVVDDDCPPHAARSGTAATSTLARRTARRDRQLREITIPPLCRSDCNETWTRRIPVRRAGMCHRLNNGLLSI